jgi:hypothetical protein
MMSTFGQQGIAQRVDATGQCIQLRVHDGRHRSLRQCAGELEKSHAIRRLFRSAHEVEPIHDMGRRHNLDRLPGLVDAR